MNDFCREKDIPLLATSASPTLAANHDTKCHANDETNPKVMNRYHKHMAVQLHMKWMRWNARSVFTVTFSQPIVAFENLKSKHGSYNDSLVLWEEECSVRIRMVSFADSETVVRTVQARECNICVECKSPWWEGVLCIVAEWKVGGCVVRWTSGTHLSIPVYFLLDYRFMNALVAKDYMLLLSCIREPAVFKLSLSSKSMSFISTFTFLLIL